MEDDWENAAAVFRSFGFSVLERPEPSDIGPDMVVIGKKQAFNVELKKVRQKPNGTLEAQPVSERQKEDSNIDFIAVCFLNGYVHVDYFERYKATISDSGYKYFTKLNPLGSRSSEKCLIK
jgi:hypothetical protein